MSWYSAEIPKLWSWEHRGQREDRRTNISSDTGWKERRVQKLSSRSGCFWKSADVAQRDFPQRERSVHVKKRWLCTIKFIREKIKDVILVSWVHVLCFLFF